MAGQVESNHLVAVLEKIAARLPRLHRCAKTMDERQWQTDTSGLNMHVHAFLSCLVLEETAEA
jgi:hypothetical protein